MKTVKVNGTKSISIDVDYVKKTRNGVSIVDANGNYITIPNSVIKKINDANGGSK